MTAVADEQLAERLADQAQPREDARRIGSSPDVRKAASAVAAGVLHEQALKTGDPGYDAEAAAHLEAAEGVGLPEAITPEMAAELGMEISGPAGAPPALTAPQVVVGPDGQRYIEVPDDVAARFGLPVADFTGEEEPVEQLAPGAYQPTPALTTTEGVPAAIPAAASLELSLPPDVAAELDEPVDLDDLDAFDVQQVPLPAAAEGEPATFGSPGSTVDLSEFEERAQYDPALAELLARNRALEKSNQHAEKERLKLARRGWLETDAAHFTAVPADAAKEIARRSKSRREFIRSMKAEHERLAPIVSQAIERERAGLAAERAEIAAERRRLQAAGWGTPVSGTAPAVQEASTTPEMLRAEDMRIAEERGGLRGRMTALVRGGSIRL